MGFTESTVSRDDPSWCALPGSPTPPASVPHVPGAAAWGHRNGDQEINTLLVDKYNLYEKIRNLIYFVMKSLKIFLNKY